MPYAYAELSQWDFELFRLLGPGLGNLLFPWARMVMAAEKDGLRMLWPTWPQLKLGPLLRRERDARFYGDLFHNPGEYIGGVRKFLIRKTYSKIDEVIYGGGSVPDRKLERSVVYFSGMDGMFEPILSHRATIQCELLRMCRSKHLQGLQHDFSKSITVHLRLGDFRKPDDALLRSGEFNVRLPLNWIKESILYLRSQTKRCIPVWIFSDGTDEQLRDLLCIPDATRLNFGSALADMLAMSRSNALVVSSTFSMWAAFLGSMPCLYYPGQMRQQVTLHPRLEIEREVGGSVPTDFLNCLLRD